MGVTIMNVTAYDIASKFLGLKEVPGLASSPLIESMLRLDQGSTSSLTDDVPWCSAFANFVCHMLGLPRSRSLAARSWLAVGTAVTLEEAIMGDDVVILKRGTGPQPGPEVLNAQGHVGFFAGYNEDNQTVRILGGNQGDAVTIASFPADRVLGVRRLV